MRWRAGPIVLISRHASLADALLPAWLLGRNGDMRPRYVMKRDLLVDPCLDIVGHRVPNWFVDREPEDGTVETDAIERLRARHGST